MLAILLWNFCNKLWSSSLIVVAESGLSFMSESSLLWFHAADTLWICRFRRRTSRLRSFSSPRWISCSSVVSSELFSILRSRMLVSLSSRSFDDSSAHFFHFLSRSCARRFSRYSFVSSSFSLRFRRVSGLVGILLIFFISNFDFKNFIICNPILLLKVTRSY